MDWVNRMSLKEDVEKLQKELVSLQGSEDINHIHHIIYITNICMFFGIATLWLPWYYVFPSILLSTGICARWTMIAHHTCHGGYDTYNDPRYNRFKFGAGSFQRRFNDWFDWMLPEAWNIYHNNLHHYNLGTTTDPDLHEHIFDSFREGKVPLISKYIQLIFLASIWKWKHLSPTTYKLYNANKIDRPHLNRNEAINNSFSPKYLEKKTLDPWLIGTVRVMLPYFVITFVLLPGAWGFVSSLLFGSGFIIYRNALTNVILAEIITNIHSFVIMTPSHCGNDVYRFFTPCIPRSGEFYLRQIIGSANYTSGSDLTDYLQGFLNFQIEHHLFPNLTLLSYRRAMPKVKQICKVRLRYGR
jgi:fatty acid desaturase